MKKPFGNFNFSCWAFFLLVGGAGSRQMHYFSERIFEKRNSGGHKEECGCYDEIGDNAIP